ncbi:uncharacterized protein LOC125603796 [Brassica napus]|uniref:uncharacterized protein LOC125603796 n=1 Tax=Brassica napus TaxID=3708 RepID=UPI002078F578|nr:uncharacterized protein LOC125603796 [Brassica napus]
MLRGMFEPSDYPALNLAGDNYLEWIKNTRVALSSRGLENCLIEYLNTGILESEMHRAITIIRYHLTEDLRDLYLHVEDPCALWLQLRQRFKPVLLKKANDQWETIRFTDFKSVDEYNSALMDICGEIITNEDLIYKTYSTFHPEDVQLINKAKKFNIYEDLLSYLLASEQRKQKIILVTIDKADKLLKRIRDLRERASGLMN